MRAASGEFEKMMKKVLFALCLLLCTAVAVAQEKRGIAGFDGGMMVHTGYLSDGGETSGVPLGIGGTARLHFGKHFRAGMEGYVSSLQRLGNGSYVKYGWGGLLGDFRWNFGRWIPYIGLTIGGGTSTSLEMTDLRDGQILGGTFGKKRFMAVDPFIGCELAVSDALHLTIKADFLLTPGAMALPKGARIYLGFIFCH